MYMHSVTCDYEPRILSVLYMPLYDYTVLYTIYKKMNLKKSFQRKYEY